jgi:hypothetical protein
MTVIDDRTSGSATVAEVANGLLKKVRTGDNAGAMDAFYHREIVSIEAAGEPREVVGVRVSKYIARRSRVRSSEEINSSCGTSTR